MQLPSGLLKLESTRQARTGCARWQSARIQADAIAGDGWDLERLQAVISRVLQHAEIDGRLDGSNIARFAHRAQTQINGSRQPEVDDYISSS